MNFDGSFRFLGSVNTALLAQALRQDTGAWVERGGGRSLPLVYDQDLRHTLPTRHPGLAAFESAIRPILAMAASFYEQSEQGRALAQQFGVGYFVRARLVEIAPQATQAVARQADFSHRHAHRVMTPLSAVSLQVDDEELTLPAGELVEVNNQRAHQIVNLDDQPAVYLELDFVLKGERCCCATARDAKPPCAIETCGLVTGDSACDCYAT